MFTFTNYPDEYATFSGVQTLPKLDYSTDITRQRMYLAPDSALRMWTRAPYYLDGWRIDVAVGDAILTSHRRNVDALCPDIIRHVPRIIRRSLRHRSLLNSSSRIDRRIGWGMTCWLWPNITNRSRWLYRHRRHPTQQFQTATLCFQLRIVGKHAGHSRSG